MPLAVYSPLGLEAIWLFAPPFRVRGLIIMIFLKKYKLWIFSFLCSFLFIFGLWYWLTVPKFSVWRVMPASAWAVVQSDNAWEAGEQYAKASKEIQLPILEDGENQWKLLAQTFQKLGIGKDFWQNKPLTTSLHITAQDEIDFLTFVEVKESKDREKLTAIFTKNTADNPTKNMWQSQQRIFERYTIYELRTNSYAFFVTFIHNHAVCSPSAFLLEESIRQYKNYDKNADISTQISLNTIGKYRFYLDSKKFFSIHFQRDMRKEFFAQIFNQFLQIQGEDLWKNGIFLDYSLPKTDAKIYPFNLAKYIPENTAWLYYVAPDISHKNLEIITKKTILTQKNNQKNIPQAQINKGSFSEKVFWENIYSNIHVLGTETDDFEALPKLILFQVKNKPNFLENLQKLNIGATYWREKYEDFYLQEMPLNDFLYSIFGKIAGNFPKSYYSMVDECIVWANDIETLKKYVDTYKKGKNWEAYPPDFVKKWQKPALFRFAFHTGRVANLIIPQLSEPFKDWAEKTQELWSSWQWQTGEIGEANTDFSYTANASYMQSVQDESLVSNISKQYTQKMKADLPEMISTMPHLVKNAQDNSQEILVQDYQNRLFLIDAKGNTIFGHKINGTLRSVPIQIDYYENKRLQYLFITAGGIHLLDRTGQYLSGFPYKIWGDSSYLKTFSYVPVREKDKPFYIMGTERHRAYMLTAQRSWVDKWKPFTLTYRLGTPAQSFFLNRKNYIILAQENGEIQVVNEQTETQKGFPVRVNGRISQPVFIEKGKDEATTFLTTVSEHGEYLKVNLLGKIIKREQLYRPSAKARFDFCVSNKNAIIVLTDYEKVMVFDKKCEKLWQDNFPKQSGAWATQFFDFAPNVKIIALTSKYSALCYLYDIEGKQLGEPFYATQPIQLQYLEEKKMLQIYYVFKRQVGMLERKWK